MQPRTQRDADFNERLNNNDDEKTTHKSYYFIIHIRKLTRLFIDIKLKVGHANIARVFVHIHHVRVETRQVKHVLCQTLQRQLRCKLQQYVQLKNRIKTIRVLYDRKSCSLRINQLSCNTNGYKSIHNSTAS